MHHEDAPSHLWHASCIIYGTKPWLKRGEDRRPLEVVQAPGWRTWDHVPGPRHLNKGVT